MSDPCRWAGKRALIVEDEAILRLHLGDMLEDLGCIVLDLATTLPAATALATTSEAEFAVLDVNLNGQLVFPAADQLHARGIPFLFCTGYGADIVPSRFATVPTIRKPFEELELRRAVNKI